MMHLLGKFVWVITALASINIGTAALFGFDVYAKMPEAAVVPVAVIVGICGVLSLVMCAHRCMGKCVDNCHNINHNHKA